MHQSPSEILKNKLKLHDLSPQQLANISGMPLTEVNRLLEEQLPFTTLRAYHLAAVFNTKPEVWLNGQQTSTKRIRSMITEG